MRTIKLRTRSDPNLRRMDSRARPPGPQICPLGNSLTLSASVSPSASCSYVIVKVLVQHRASCRCSLRTGYRYGGGHCPQAESQNLGCLLSTRPSRLGAPGPNMSGGSREPKTTQLSNQCDPWEGRLGNHGGDLSGQKKLTFTEHLL